MTGKQIWLLSFVIIGTVGALLWLPPVAGFASSVMAAGTWCHALEQV